MVSVQLDLIARSDRLNIEGFVSYDKLACLLIIRNNLNIYRLNNLLALYYENKISAPVQLFVRL